MGEPAVRSGGLHLSWPAARPASGRKPSMSPTANRAPAGTFASSAAALAESAKRAWAMNAFAALSLSR